MILTDRVHVPGLGAYGRRGRHWHLVFWRDGHEVTRSVTRLLKRPPARITIKDVVRCLAEHASPTAPALLPRVTASRVTVQTLLDAYVAATARRKSAKDIRTECRHLGIALGTRRAASVDYAVIDRYATDAMAAGFAPGTVKKRVGYLRAAYRHGRRQRLVAVVPECPALEGSTPRQGFYDPEDFAARLRHVPPGVFADLFESYYLLGWRRNELLALEWTMVDRVTGVLRLADDKAGDGGVVPISPELAVIVERRWADRATRRGDGRVIVGRYVFHGPWGGRLRDEVYTIWYRACEAAGYPVDTAEQRARNYLHNFRRSVARDLIAGGASEADAMRVTRHKTASTFKRYQIRDTRDLARAQAGMAAFRQEALDASRGPTRANPGKRAAGRLLSR